MKMRCLLSLIFVFSVSAHAAEEVAEPVATESVIAESQELPAATMEQSAVTGKAETRKESEIPLNLEANKKAAGEGGGFFRLLMTLSMLGVVGSGAFFFLRKYKVPRAMKHQTQIKVLQQHYLGPKKSLAIVRVAGESILIGVTDHNISMIKSLSLLDDEVPEEAPRSFGKVLRNSNEQDLGFDDAADLATTATAPRKRNTRDLDPDEEFAITGIKDIVSKRLKGMRSFQ